MKLIKVFALVLAVAMLACCFVACGETKATEKATEKATDAATEKATEAATEKQTLKMATNAYFQPYEYYEGGKVVGIDAEIAQAIADYLGCNLEIVDMKFDTIIGSVQEGEVDFGMAGMTVREDRLEKVDFTSSYASGVQVIIVKEDSSIASIDDLVGKKIAVQLGTTGDAYATGDYGAENITAYSNGNEAVLALVGGDVECVILDNEPAKALVAANAGLKILDTSYADEDYAICVKKGNSTLLNSLNEAIDALTLDGTIDAIINKYIH